MKEEMEHGTGWVIGLRFHSMEVAETGFESRDWNSRTQAFSR